MIDRPWYRIFSLPGAVFSVLFHAITWLNRVVCPKTLTVLADQLSVVSATAGGTMAAAPPPFRPSNPALCGSCPLVSPCECRLGDFVVLIMCISFCVYIIVCVYVYLVVFSYVASPSVL